LSVTVGYISQIERGITKINLETLSLIAEYLHCDITEFLSDTVKMSSTYLNEDFSSIIKNLTPYKEIGEGVICIPNNTVFIEEHAFEDCDYLIR
jgi:transcriptional regulator with XRE-family HTH domain